MTTKPNVWLHGALTAAEAGDVAKEFERTGVRYDFVCG